MQTIQHKQFMAAAAKKRARVVRLRDEGKTFDEVGAAVGITRQRAAQIYTKEKRKAKA